MDAEGGALDEKALGKQLQRARQKAGLTQQALCQKANLSYSTLAKIERGAIKSPSIFTIQSIAIALNTSLDELVGSPASMGPDRTYRQTKSGAGFIYFDVNGCLVRGYYRAFGIMAEQSGRPVDVVESAFWHYNDAVCKGEMSLSDFNTALAERLNLTDFEWSRYYLDAIEPVAEMHELVRWAHEHYRVGLFTNIMPGLLAAMKSQGALPDIPFDAVIDSSEVGAIKPEPQIYQIAQERAGVPASQILLIDDTRANLMAAEKAGWSVLWFDGYEPKESAERLRVALEPTGEPAAA